MKIDNDKIRDEKLQCDIDKKISKNINIIIWEFCEEITGEEILPTDQNKMIEQAKFTYSPLGKILENK